MVDIELLERNMKRRLAHMPERMRLYTTEYGQLPSAVIITGARGCGKSTFLLYHAKEANMLYLSLDNPLISTYTLYGIVEHIFLNAYDGVILDEVHYAADWSRHLKAIYDDFPGKKIWVSDSSALVLRAGNADLSRRYVAIKMPMMSFREFLHIETGKSYATYHLGGELPVAPDGEILRLFNLYRKHGARPCYQ